MELKEQDEGENEGKSVLQSERGVYSEIGLMFNQGGEAPEMDRLSRRD